jgi:hypothetical protein
MIGPPYVTVDMFSILFYENRLGPAGAPQSSIWVDKWRKKEDRQTEKKNSVTIGLITKLQGKKLKATIFTLLRNNF